MASRGAISAGVMSVALSTAGLAAPYAVQWEGWVNRTYPDLVGKATACAGVTNNIQANRLYSDPQCQSMTAVALVDHALGIAPCLPPDVPTYTRVAFVLAAYNIGVNAFCGSSMSKKALAGDLRGACASLSLWDKATIYGRKVQVKGLTYRRAHERGICEDGLQGRTPAPAVLT